MSMEQRLLRLATQCTECSGKATEDTDYLWDSLAAELIVLARKAADLETPERNTARKVECRCYRCTGRTLRRK